MLFLASNGVHVVLFNKILYIKLFICFLYIEKITTIVYGINNNTYKLQRYENTIHSLLLCIKSMEGTRACRYTSCYVCMYTVCIDTIGEFEL